MFIKMDLWWGYNNVRIKEGDGWKAVFLMPERSFEPMVMFFGLTNSPATFQAMMNDLLRDMVVEEKVVVFIDDVINHSLLTSSILLPLSYHVLPVSIAIIICKTSKMCVED